MLQVTETFLPPFEKYSAYVERYYKSGWITNRGELVMELEDRLKEFLKVPFITLTTNGTLPLQIAIEALQLKGCLLYTSDAADE